MGTHFNSLGSIKNVYFLLEEARPLNGIDMTVTQVTRSSILDLILLGNRPFHGRMDLMTFLRRIWDLSSMPSTDRRFKDADGDIWQHMVNNDDWSYQELLCERLNLLRCDDTTFFRFLETCLHPLAVEDEVEAESMANAFNERLAKDGYKLVVSSRISGRAVYTVEDSQNAGHQPDHSDVFEIVLSFAGEDRAYVERVAEFLRERDVRCFYDRYEDVTLWGKDLTEHLDRVYQSARYCVMFISQHYANKVWTNHERKSALARAVKEKIEYILPARFDDTEIPGVRHTIGYVDLRDKLPEQLGEMILRKLGRTGYATF
jgi:hypothetical protein